MILLVIIYILIFIIFLLVAFSVAQVRAAGMKVKDFWSFIEANQMLVKLYRFSRKYERLNSREQIIFLQEAEKVFDAFDKVPEILWEEEYQKYMEVLDKYKSVKIYRWVRKLIPNPSFINLYCLTVFIMFSAVKPKLSNSSSALPDLTNVSLIPILVSLQGYSLVKTSEIADPRPLITLWSSTEISFLHSFAHLIIKSVSIGFIV